MTVLPPPECSKDMNDVQWTYFPEGRAFDCEVFVVKESEGYSTHCAKLPGTVGEGDTIEAALANISEVLPVVLSIYLEEDGSIPWCENVIEGQVVCKKRILINA